jgi:hypothetical protein
MPRLCSESSRSYPGRSVSHAMRPALWKIPDRTTRATKVPAYPVAIAGYERIIGSKTSRILIAHHTATYDVIVQKSVPPEYGGIDCGHSSPMLGVMPETRLRIAPEAQAL